MTDKVFVSNWNDQTFAVLITLLNSFLDRLPLIPGLTADERKAIQNIAEGRLAYAEKALEYVKDYRAEINVTADELTRISLIGSDFQKLMHLRRLVTVLLARLIDGSVLVGGNFYAESRIVHESIELAVKKGKSGLRAALDDLDKLYATQGNRTPRTTENGVDENLIPGNGNDDTPVS